MSTVHICLNDILGVAVACEVIFYPGDTPFFNGTALAVSGACSIRLDAEGNGSVTLLSGRYTVRFSGITSNTDTLLIQVPNDDEDYPLPELICGGNWVLPMRDFLQKSKNLSDVANPSAAFDAIKQAATPTTAGAICLASQAEADAGTDATKAVTPATLANLAKWATAGQKVKFITTADAATRLALTQAQVSTGDLIEQMDTSAVYQVLHATQLNQESSYVLIGTRPETTGTLNDGLVAYWKLDEESGTRVDSTGNGNDLTDNNSVGYAIGKINSAAVFDGTNYLSASLISQTLSAATISFWFKGGAQTFQYGAILEMVDAGESSEAYLGIYPNPHSDAEGLDIYNGDGWLGDSGVNVCDNAWHHICATIDSSGSIECYIDGNLVITGSYGQQVNPGTILHIGTNGNGEFLTGLVDEAGIWNRALSQAEIAQLYNSGNGLSCPI